MPTKQEDDDDTGAKQPHNTNTNVSLLVSKKKETSACASSDKTGHRQRQQQALLLDPDDNQYQEDFSSSASAEDQDMFPGALFVPGARKAATVGDDDDGTVQIGDSSLVHSMDISSITGDSNFTPQEQQGHQNQEDTIVTATHVTTADLVVQAENAPDIEAVEALRRELQQQLELQQQQQQQGDAGNQNNNSGGNNKTTDVQVAATTTENNRSRRFWITILVIILLLVMVVLITTISIVATNSNNESDEGMTQNFPPPATVSSNPASTETQPPMITDEPTVIDDDNSATTFEPTMDNVTPSPSEAPTDRLLSITQLISLFFPENDDFTSSLIQQERLRWIAYDDPVTANLPLFEVDYVNSTTDNAYLILERFILSLFYDTLDGDEWSNNNLWLTRTSVCAWIGLSCNNEFNVKSLVMQSNGLHGSIPTELAKLSRLETINVEGPTSTDGREIFGTIPTEFGWLTNLKLFLWGTNGLQGTLPTELGLMTSLTKLALGRFRDLNSIWQNELVGTIPTEIALLTNLNFLDLDNNLLTGTVPTELGLLTGLTTLALGNNRFTGELPQEVLDLNIENISI